MNKLLKLKAIIEKSIANSKVSIVGFAQKDMYQEAGDTQQKIFAHQFVLACIDDMIEESTDHNELEIVQNDFVAIAKLHNIVVCFSNKPYCQYAYKADNCECWVNGFISNDKEEIITHQSQILVCDGIVYIGTNKGNIYWKNHGEFKWTIINRVSFADNDPVLHLVATEGVAIYAVSRSGICIKSCDSGRTWSEIKIETVRDIEFCDGVNHRPDDGKLCLIEAHTHTGKALGTYDSKKEQWEITPHLEAYYICKSNAVTSWEYVQND